ncbi:MULTISPECIES: transcriptional regulator FeaR [Pseudomonas]|uniref:transcriptional regulator FeaR n=1 Tax=Pseudomonas TaxID=286 RepID=UPI0004DAC5E5|nr:MULTISPECIES: transcriptional regulator FeaR [Pseudomonas]KES23251.1 transcriptional regulator [Pseudomonas sp. AAC]MBH3435495.1 transcriptional regulator FeaR [Pseudomonas citronellolis]OHR93709.1 transcriptional regulator [Pseudomonas sp. HMSC75E02]WRT80656.1 transcriptional regulator FeaR [Pseudomonas citronellolis]
MQAHHAAQVGLEGWSAALRSICGQFETQLAFSRSLFIGEIHAQSHSGLTMAHLRTNAGLIARKRLNADQDDDRHCFLISQRSGFSQVSQNGVDIQLAPGELLLMDSVGSCEITPFGLIEHASLHLPRAALDKVLPGRSKFGKVSAACASGRMLHLLVDQLCRESGSNPAGAESEALENAFIALLPTALGSHGETPGSEALQGGNLRSYVQKVIDESLTQPGLNPQGLAQRLNISVRHLYRLFEEQGDSVCRYIQRARLQRSADDLANPILRGESITTIAYKWGFTDSAHFSRAFKKHFERSPKDYRASALSVA